MGPLEENGDLYRINYSNIPDENSADLVVARTKVFRFLSTIGEYCFFMKNCENFATFCKTGFIIRDQLEWLISQVKQSMHLGIGLQYAHCFPYEGIAALTGGENSRLSACVGGAALGATGSYALGQLIGSTVGSQIGGPSGYFVGKMIGTWLGGRIGKYIEI
ncbi:hypothetical protein MAR_011452 [Mya arenaria]|uniref:LRAT domain-containing protein n=1 Tax=Mya arenaria TaxID=6604 RepID=A0ABY7FXY7_MYAAR|nr:hypothetical protein MAR_011452 [Mya arenaria]